MLNAKNFKTLDVNALRNEEMGNMTILSILLQPI